MQRAHNSKHLWPPSPHIPHLSLCLLESMATPKISYKNTTQTRLINVRISKDFRFVFVFFSSHNECAMFKDIPPFPDPSWHALSPPMTARLLCECQKQRQAKQFTIKTKRKWKARKSERFVPLFLCRLLTHANELAARRTCPAHLQQSRSAESVWNVWVWNGNCYTLWPSGLPARLPSWFIYSRRARIYQTLINRW